MPVTEVPPSRKCYIYILFFGAREASESKMNFFGGLNLHYNSDAFWKNGARDAYFDICERREFFEKVHVKQVYQK